MGIPEQVHDFDKGNLRWIEIDLQRLGVIVQIVISRRWTVAARIADSRSVDTAKTPKLGIGSPESTKSEGRCLQAVGNAAVNRRNRNR